MKKYFFLLITLLFFQAFMYAQTYRLNKTFGGYNTGPVRIIALSTDGNFLACNGKEGDINIIAADTGKIIKTLKGHTNDINSLKFSSNGEYLLSASADGTVILWNIKNGTALKTIQISQDNSPGKSLSFADFGKAENELIFGGENMQLYKTEIIYNTKKSTEPLSIFTGQQVIKTGMYSPDKTFYIFSQGNLLYIKKDGEPSAKVFGTASDEITAVTISKDGNFIAARCKNSLIDIWNTEKAIKIKTFKSASKTKEDDYTQLSFSDDGKYLVTGSNDGMPTVWNVEDSKSLFDLYGHNGKVIPVLFSGEKNIIITGSDDGTIKVWQIIPLKEEITEKKPQKNKDTFSINELPSPQLTFGSEKDTLPSSLAGRDIISTNPKPLVFSSRSITIYVWDDDQADGDIISLNLNGKWILEKYQLNKKKKIVNVKLEAYKNNVLLLYAHNEGKIPPNTAGISIFDGFSETKLNLKSDLKTCDAVKLLLK